MEQVCLHWGSRVVLCNQHDRFENQIGVRDGSDAA